MAQPDLREEFFASVPRYEFLETLGRGGMGIVFKARDRELDDVIAVKVLSSVEDVSRDELLARFKNEISLARRIKHPNVARLFDYGLAGANPYLTMEFVEGRDLWKILKDGGRMDAAQALPILRQIALGTSAAHEAGIIHRDLKPQNVMVDAEGGVAILDFGLARGPASRGLTTQGTTVGTPAYMSPEQARGKPLDGRSDVYSIGVIAFEMLAGVAPFTGDSPVAVVMQHLHDPIPVWRLKELRVPPEVIAVIGRCLQKEAEDRFSSAAELAAQLMLLERIVRGGPPIASRTRVEQPSDRHGAVLPPDLEVELPHADALKQQADIATPARPARAAPAADVVKRRPVVLVVDDEPQVRQLVSAFLEPAGCDTRHAESGEAALRILGESPADLILLDVIMPVIDGFDTARIIRSQPAHARTPIIFMSSFMERNRVAFASQSGGQDFLPKPLDFPTLVRSVWSILREKGFRPPS